MRWVLLSKVSVYAFVREVEQRLALLESTFGPSRRTAPRRLRMMFDKPRYMVVVRRRAVRRVLLRWHPAWAVSFDDPAPMVVHTDPMTAPRASSA